MKKIIHLLQSLQNVAGGYVIHGTLSHAAVDPVLLLFVWQRIWETVLVHIPLQVLATKMKEKLFRQEDYMPFNNTSTWVVVEKGIERHKKNNKNPKSFVSQCSHMGFIFEVTTS